MFKNFRKLFTTEKEYEHPYDGCFQCDVYFKVKPICRAHKIDACKDCAKLLK